jgi:uncharacterized protein
MKILTLVMYSLFLGVSFLAAQDQAPAPAPATSDSTVASASAPKIDPAKAADIQRLIEVAGARQLLIDTMAKMQANIRPTLIKTLPSGPYREKLINLFFERLQTKMSVQQFLDMAAAAYDKYLTDDDVKALIAFYQTPLGQKTLTVLPKMAAELQAQGMRIGEEAGRESMQEVLAEHPELARSMQDAAALRQ